MKVTLARALKEKNRVAGKIHSLMDLVVKGNVHDEDELPELDLKRMVDEIKSLEDHLVGIKAKIAMANHPVNGKLTEMAELKAMMAFLGKVNTKEESRFSFGDSKKIKKVAVISAAELIEEKDEYQKRINKLQDDLDEHNAVTFVDIELSK